MDTAGSFRMWLGPPSVDNPRRCESSRPFHTHLEGTPRSTSSVLAGCSIALDMHTVSSANGEVDLRYPSALPRRLHRAAVVSTAHPRNCLGAWDACEHGDRRQRCPGPPDAAATCELDALERRAFVGLGQCGDRVVRGGRCSEVGPPHPSVVPVEGPGIARQEVDAEFGLEAVGQRLAQAATADPAAAGKLHDARTIGPPDHDSPWYGRVCDHGPSLRRNPRPGYRWDVGALVAIEERKKLLSEVWLFNGATDEELTMLAELAYEVTVGPHVDIVNENEFGDELFLVVDGHAAVTRRGVDLGVLNAGDFFGEMALLGTGVRTSTVRSVVAMTLLGLRAEHFDDVLASHPMVDRRLAELEGRPRTG